MTLSFLFDFLYTLKNVSKMNGLLSRSCQGIPTFSKRLFQFYPIVKDHIYLHAFIFPFPYQRVWNMYNSRSIYLLRIYEELELCVFKDKKLSYIIIWERRRRYIQHSLLRALYLYSKFESLCEFTTFKLSCLMYTRASPLICSYVSRHFFLVDKKDIIQDFLYWSQL